MPTYGRAMGRFCDGAWTLHAHMVKRWDAFACTHGRAMLHMRWRESEREREGEIKRERGGKDSE